MKRRDMLRSGVRQEWRGLMLQVATPRWPAVRVEVAPPRRIRIAQAGAPVLWSKIDADHGGHRWLVSGRWKSPLPPIDFTSARAIDPSGGYFAWFARWAHWIASNLDIERSPLHAGTWSLRPGLPSESRPEIRIGVDAVRVTRSAEVATLQESGYDDWWDNDAAVLPLRKLSNQDTSRVKALRKLAAEGVLPPIVLWWVGGLAAFCIVDGHDRLAAALDGRHAPTFVVLTRVVHYEDQASRELFYLEKLERIASRGQGDGHHARALGELLGRATLRREEGSRTIAFPIPGGAAEWDAEVRATNSPYTGQLLSE